VALVLDPKLYSHKILRKH